MEAWMYEFELAQIRAERQDRRVIPLGPERQCPVFDPDLPPLPPTPVALPIPVAA